MRRIEKTFTTTGADGSAAVTDHITINGWLLNVFAVPGAGQAATLDMTVFEQCGTSERTLHTATNVSAARNCPIMVQAVDSTNTGIAGVYTNPPVCGELKFRFAQGNSAKTVTVYVHVADDPPGAR